MRNLKLRQLTIAIISIIVLLLAGCMPTAEKKEDKLTVYTTLYPLTFFAQEIGGANADVKNLIPPHADPHEFELSPRDLTKLTQADLFIYNGAGLEVWIKRTESSLAKESKVKLLDSSAKINELNQNDPHIWLDPLLGIKQVEQITEAFCKLDAKHADYYNKNSAALIQKLLKLDQDFKEAFSFKHKPFVVAHAAFGYLATRYHLEQLAVYGLTTTHEASLKELLHLKKRMQQDQIRYLFFDGTARPKVAEELRCEMGATALELSSLEKLTVKERAQGDDYFKIMYRNLRRLKQAVKD